jgi:hypothetical protein
VRSFSPALRDTPLRRGSAVPRSDLSGNARDVVQARDVSALVLAHRVEIDQAMNLMGITKKGRLWTRSCPDDLLVAACYFVLPALMVAT